ncbi:unnamed protein product [Blepharisma stoltei]|uniref:GAR domain-containing protein n=1 Tax=Blepharisma stoltei TaxID=1481888 RepID=A0AAU9J664_9CILI|nr:unnamed protein product [Blepharisma stoltei]
MKYKFEISILEVQGLGDGPFDYTIALDSTEQQLFDTDTFEIYGEGNFSLGIQKADEGLCGFKIPMNVLHGYKTKWFPVSCPYIELTTLDCDIGTPCVLLSITEITVLSPVIERREISECSRNTSPVMCSPQNYVSELMPDIQNEAKFAYNSSIKLELEQKELFTVHLKDLLYASKEETTKLRTAYGDIREQMNECLNDFQEKKSELIKEIEEAREEKSKAEAKISALELRIIKLESENLKLTHQISHNNRVFEFNQKSEQEDLEGKLIESENERKKLQEALISAHAQWEGKTVSSNGHLEKENQLLEDKNKILSERLRNAEFQLKENATKVSEQHYLNQIHSLNSKISNLQNENESLQQQSQELLYENNQFRDALEKLKSTIIKQEEENSELSEQLKLAIENISTSRSSRTDVDTELKGYLLKIGIKNPFVKISEGLYSLGNKKFSISLRNGAPVIRVGGGYMFIEEFLKIYLTQTKKKSEEDENPKRSLSSEPKLGKGKTLEPLYKDDCENNMSMNEIINMTPVQTPLKSDSSCKDLKKQMALGCKAKILNQVPKLQTSLREYTPLSSRRVKIPK